MFGTSGGGHAAQRTMRDLRRAVMLMGAKERADNVVVGVPTLKTNWRKRPEREVEGPPKRRKPRMKEVVLPPVEAKAVVEKELSEYAFLDANKQEETEWKGPSRPMQDLWQDRWTEMRYLWERLRTAFGADALVLGTKVRAGWDILLCSGQGSSKSKTHAMGITVVVHTAVTAALLVHSTAPSHGGCWEAGAVLHDSFPARGRQDLLDQGHIPTVLHRRVHQLPQCGSVQRGTAPHSALESFGRRRKRNHRLSRTRLSPAVSAGWCYG